MSLPQWMRQFAQQWLPRNGKRTERGYAIRTRQWAHPHLEVLEDRLTPSGEVLAFTTAAQTFGSDQLSPPITVQLQNSSGKPALAASNLTVNLSSTSSGGGILPQLFASYEKGVLNRPFPAMRTFLGRPHEVE